VNPEEYGKEMYGLIQKSIDNTMSMLSMLQEQNEKMFGLVADQTVAAQTEARKMIEDWVKKGKEAQGTYRKMLEENLKKVFQMKPK
jgi:predicted transcriptional regulator